MAKSTQGTSVTWKNQATTDVKSCSICNNNADGSTVNSQSSSSRPQPLQRQQQQVLSKIGLDTSFVNIPYSYYPDVASLRVSSDDGGVGTNSSSAQYWNQEIMNGEDMQDASRQIDVFLQAAMSILSEHEATTTTEEQRGVEEEGTASSNPRSTPITYYCPTCIEQISLALETCCDQLDNECIVYDTVASAEEDRTSMLCNILSMHAYNNGLGVIDVHDEEEEDAIHRAIDSFQHELEALVNACNEQRTELNILQNLMQDQLLRSDILSHEEDNIYHNLNALEIETRNFVEESHLVNKNYELVQSEIDAMSNVQLLSIPFTIRTKKDGGGGYPTINNLRLAYRINSKAGLYHNEIDAAFVQAAQLVVFTIGLYPNFSTSGIIRLIPIHPCAKILVHLSSDDDIGQSQSSVHNLGFDTTTTTTINNSNEMELSNIHVPTQSITLFLVILSQLCSHILTCNNHPLPRQKDDDDYDQPPFPMTECSIDGVDVTNLKESNTAAWSSVIFCIAANLQWLSELRSDLPQII